MRQTLCAGFALLLFSAACDGTVASVHLSDDAPQAPSENEQTGVAPQDPVVPPDAATGSPDASVTPPPPPSSADTQAPTVPQALRAMAQSASEIRLWWAASTDNVQVAGYRVFRGTTQVASVSGNVLSYADTGLSPSTAYTYSVRAGDAAGNVSPPSDIVSATTLSAVVAWPDASNTGVPAGRSLTVSGSLTVTQNNQIIEDKDIRGSVTVQANNVTLRNCRITHSSTAVTLQSGFDGLVIEDTTIVGQTGSTFTKGILADGTITLRRVNLSGYTSGMLISGGGGSVEDSYFHDLANPQGRASDAIELWSSQHVIIRHNHLNMNTTDANTVIKLPTDVPYPGGTDVLVDNNLLAGGGWTVIAGYEPANGSRSWSNVRITNNRFSTQYSAKCGYWGTVASYQSSLTSGNVWHETGAALKL